MRQRPEWFGRYDEPILEFFEETGIAAPPAVVTFNLDWWDVVSPAHSTVKRRMKTLSENGMLKVVDGDAGYYALDEKGQDFLTEDQRSE
jgi:predicted transcriptional regulator